MKVIMVDKNKDFLLVTFQVMAPGFENFNNNYKLIVVNNKIQLNKYATSIKI